MIIGSAGESRAQYLAHSGAGAVAAGEIRIAANFFGSACAQGRANLGAALLEVGEFYLALDFYAERAEALDQQCFMLVLRENEGKRKGGETLPQIPDRNTSHRLGFDPEIDAGDFVAAINYGLSESELLIELKRAPLNGQCTGGSTGGRQLVDDSHAHPESGQPQGQHQARRTCANDEHLRWVGPVDLAHSGKSQGSARFRFGGFLFAIPRGRVGLKRVEQLARRGLDFIDRAEER